MLKSLEFLKWLRSNCPTKIFSRLGKKGSNEKKGANEFFRCLQYYFDRMIDLLLVFFFLEKKGKNGI